VRVLVFINYPCIILPTMGPRLISWHRRNWCLVSVQWHVANWSLGRHFIRELKRWLSLGLTLPTRLVNGYATKARRLRTFFYQHSFSHTWCLPSLSTSYEGAGGSYDRWRCEASCLLLATNIGYWFVLHCDISLGAMVGKMRKCH